MVLNIKDEKTNELKVRLGLEDNEIIYEYGNEILCDGSYFREEGTNELIVSIWKNQIVEIGENYIIEVSPEEFYYTRGNKDKNCGIQYIDLNGRNLNIFKGKEETQNDNLMLTIGDIDMSAIVQEKLEEDEIALDVHYYKEYNLEEVITKYKLGEFINKFAHNNGLEYPVYKMNMDEVKKYMK